MPTISMFYGIIVTMYKEQGGKHNCPHLHARFAGTEIAVALDGTVLAGELPANKMKLLVAWMEIHYDELVANWDLLCNDQQFFKIEPLR